MLETINITQTVFTFVVIMYSIILHEVAHGYAAFIQGDETAYRMGRLTLNPLPHIDMMGSVIVPLFAFLSLGTFFGWAKPVPYNAHNIRTRVGQAFVAAAGVLTNLLIAFIVGIVFKVLVLQQLLTVGTAEALFTIITINVSLAFFNLIPIPPFDGMSILQALFPRLHIQSRIIYSPLFMIVAILAASVLYGRIMPTVMAGVQALLF
jgi:Zn-dependent protease